jgi:hypothetical protein
MGRIVVGTYVVRFPVGGYLSWVLQWLLGFQRLGYEVYLVEKSGWTNSCYDPTTDSMGDDCSYGIAALNDLLERFGLANRWCFVDAHGNYCGLERQSVRSVFKSADLFIDMGTHGTWLGSWLEEASETKLSVLVDGDPAYTQMEMEKSLMAGEVLQPYDYHYSVGLNVGTDRCTAPTAGIQWRPVCDPVIVELFPSGSPPADAPFTTVMSWQAYSPIAFDGLTFGMKDIEFQKFIDLPRRTTVPLELALSGDTIPLGELAARGWRIRESLDVTLTFDSFRQYIASSRGEFSVCKNVFVATNSGCFSERSAAYLASGRPVVMQDTGFSQHIPCGRGLFAVRDVDEAAAAIEEIGLDYARHSQWARELAMEYLDASKVLGKFLSELGV